MCEGKVKNNKLFLKHFCILLIHIDSICEKYCWELWYPQRFYEKWQHGICLSLHKHFLQVWCNQKVMGQKQTVAL